MAAKMQKSTWSGNLKKLWKQYSSWYVWATIAVVAWWTGLTPEEQGEWRAAWPMIAGSGMYAKAAVWFAGYVAMKGLPQRTVEPAPADPPPEA